MDPIEIQKRFAQLKANGGAQAMADYADELLEQTYDNARRTARVVYAITGVMLLGMAGGAFALSVGSALGSSAAPPGTGAAIGTGVAALFLALFAVLLWRNFAALRPPPRELATTGIPAKLTIRDYRSTSGGFRLNDNGSQIEFTRVALDLDVAPSEGAPYTVTVREYLTGRAFVKLAPGAVISGYVDRANPARIYLDWRARSPG